MCVGFRLDWYQTRDGRARRKEREEYRESERERERERERETERQRAGREMHNNRQRDRQAIDKHAPTRLSSVSSLTLLLALLDWGFSLHIFLSIHVYHVCPGFLTQFTDH